MALFKICRGKEANLPSTLTNGYAYFCTDTTNFYIDHLNASDTLVRSKISSKYAEKLRYSVDGTTVEIDPSVIELNTNKVTTLDDTATDTQYPSAKAVYDAINNADYIMSVDKGNIIEYGEPKELLKNKNSFYRYLMEKQLGGDRNE